MGEARREAILALALRAADGRRQRRRLTRSAGAAGVFFVLAAAAILVLRPGHPSGPVAIVKSHPGPSPSPSPAPRTAPTARAHDHPQAAVTIVRLPTEPGIAARLSLPAEPSGGTPAALPRVSDDELLARLAEAGRPAGLAYLDDRPVLVFHDRNPSLTGGGTGQKGGAPSHLPPGL